MASSDCFGSFLDLWAHSVIMCGHFPEGVETFAKASIDGETRGEWYLRQMIGSANIKGNKAMHIMTGNLSHQIEHHLSRTYPATGTPKSPRGSRRSAADTACRTYPGRFPARWAQLGNGSSSCRYPTTSRSTTPPSGYGDVGPERMRCSGSEGNKPEQCPKEYPHADTERPLPCLTAHDPHHGALRNTKDERHGRGRVPGIV